MAIIENVAAKNRIKDTMPISRLNGNEKRVSLDKEPIVKKYTPFLLLLAVVLLVTVSSAQADSWSGGAFENFGDFVLQRLVEIIQRLAEILPSFLEDFFMKVISFFQDLLGS